MKTVDDEYTPTRYRDRLPAHIPPEPEGGDAHVEAVLAKTPDKYLKCQGDGHRWPDLLGDDEDDRGLIWQRVLAEWPNGTTRLGAQDRACRTCGLVRTTVYVFYPGHDPVRVGDHTYDYKTVPGYCHKPDPDGDPDQRAPTRAEKEAALVRRSWARQLNPSTGDTATTPAKKRARRAPAAEAPPKKAVGKAAGKGPAKTAKTTKRSA